MSYVPKCLKCRAPLPFQEAADGSTRKPNEGDVAICFECGEAMVFEGRGFRLPTTEEFRGMLRDEEFARALAAVAVKVSGHKDPAAVIVSDNGVATVIGPEPPTICEMCGKLEETRPYGPRKPDGVRMRVCFDCGMKDEAELERALDERIEGRS